MWRRNALGGTAEQDRISDQSLSEEDECLEDPWAETYRSLNGVSAKKQGGMQILSQLEMLTGHHEFQPSNKDSFSSHVQREIGFCDEDEVENPIFNGEENGSNLNPRIANSRRSNKGTIYLPTIASILNSDDEIISDDERVNSPAVESVKEDVGSTWSEASREAEALQCLHEKFGSSSSHAISRKPSKSSKGGGRGKPKPKFSFRFQSKEDLPLVVGDDTNLAENISPPDEIDAAAHRVTGKSKTQSRLVLIGENAEQPENHIERSEPSRKYRFKEKSMAESLVCFHEKNDLMRDGCLDDDDIPDVLDSETSSDNEENVRGPNSMVPRTMADRFDEALAAVSVTNESSLLALNKPSGRGLFGKLQRVMLNEKERDTEYLKVSRAENSSKDGKICFRVRILSRSLEAKLTVCTCTSIKDEENSLLEINSQMKRKGSGRTVTIIFSPRMSSDVDLEVDNVIEIHPPWKEVQVMEKDDAVILCSYFSQIQ